MEQITWPAAFAIAAPCFAIALMVWAACHYERKD